MISIKDLTKQTGLSVRTLRYYDQIELLKPSAKTAGGHRLYGQDELIKLQQIQFLKTMGFSLQEIKEMLTDPHWDWTSSLNNQLDHVLREQEKFKQMEAALRGLLHGLTVQGEMSLADLQKLILLSKQDQKQRQAFRKKMFDKKEAKLIELLPNMNRNDPDSLEWIALLGQLQRYMKEGPHSVQVQQIMRRMEEKTNESFSEADVFLDKLWEIRKSPEQSTQMGLYPIDQELLDFIEQAYEIFLSAKTELEDGRANHEH